MSNKNQEYTGYSQASLDAAIEDALKQTEQPLRVIEAISSLMEGTHNQYRVTLAPSNQKII